MTEEIGPVEQLKAATRTRREALRVVGAAAAGIVAGSVVSPKAALAADGGNMILGQDNVATVATSLTSSSTDDGLVVNAVAAGSAVTISGGGTGVSADGVIGVVGFGEVGGIFAGNTAAIGLTPSATSGPPPDDGFNAVGDMIVDADGVLYLCIANSPDANWTRVAPAGIQLLPTPVRRYDSRNAGGKFADGATRNLVIAGADGIPADAIGMVGNVTVTETVGGGWVTLYPGGTTKPATSNINYTGANQTVANAVTVGLGTDGSVAIYAQASTHVILDIAGYIL